MSYIQRLSIQQRRGKRIINFDDREQQSLRQTMIQRANKLKEKIAEETNTFDFSVQKLMNQTLKEVQKHKQNFQNQHNHLALIYRDEEYERKKALLKDELHKKLETCKNKYKQKISHIKNKKGRFYTPLNKQDQQKISIEDMLKTAKNKFKFQRKDILKKQRNKSQIIQLKKINKKQITNFLHKNYPAHSALTFQSSKKQEYDNISIYMIKVRQNKNFESSPSMERTEKNTDFSPQKLHATQIISMPSHSSKKSLIKNYGNKRKVYPNGYQKFNQSQISNVQNLSNSEKSIFIPMGKVALSNQRKKMITEFQVTNTHKKERKNRANKLSSEIVAEFVEIQLSDNNYKKKTKIFLPLNKKLKTDHSIQFKEKNMIIENLTPIKTSRNEYEMESPSISLFKSQKQQKMTPKSKYFQKQEQMSNKDKDFDEIRCMININDVKVQGTNEKQKNREAQKKNEKFGLKSILYNKKVNQLSRKMMKNYLNTRIPTKKYLKTQINPYDNQTNSKTMLLDIKGNPMRLQKSVKVQKVKNRQTLDNQQYLYQ